MLNKLPKNDDLVSGKQIISHIKDIEKKGPARGAPPNESDVDAREISTLKDSNI